MDPPPFFQQALPLLVQGRIQGGGPGIDLYSGSRKKNSRGVQFEILKKIQV